MTLNQLESRIQNAKELDFGDIFDKCIKLFKQVWLQGFLTILIAALLTVPFYFLFTFLLEAIGVNVSDPSQLGDFSFGNLISFYSTNALYNIPLSIITSFISLTMVAGFYRICKQKESKESESENYFYFFKGEYFNKMLIIALIYTAIMTLSQMICMVPYIYTVVPLMYFSAIFAFNSERSAEEIIKISFMIGNKKWLISFGAIFVTGILGCLGVLACGIGVLFTMPLVYLPVYVIYKEIVGFDEDDEIMKIGSEQY